MSMQQEPDGLSINLEFPRELLAALDIPESHLNMFLKEIIVLELFREKYISSGKGAELLGLSKEKFAYLLARHGINYFTVYPDELKSDVMAVGQLLSEENS